MLVNVMCKILYIKLLNYAYWYITVCESDDRIELSKSSEPGGQEDHDQGLDMSVERKLKIEETLEEEEKQNGTSHGSPRESDNEESNCESPACSADDETLGRWRADVRLVGTKMVQLS
jgi:hypothetical protein